MNTILKTYIQNRFNWSNHVKYRKYCEEWINNLTPTQIQYFEKEMKRREFLNIKTY